MRLRLVIISAATIIAILILPDHTRAESVLRKRLRVSRHDSSSPPDFQAKTVDSRLASKLAGMRLGRFHRLRRQQTESDLKKDADSAQVNSAVAAIQAEEAKESALNAFNENEKIEQYISSGKVSSSASATNSQSKSEQKSTSRVNEDEEEYEDDDDDNDEAEETIVEDETVTIKTITSGGGHKKQSNATRLGISSAPPPSDGAVCQGLLDLKRMTDDFRERLKSLIDREEQVVERLEQFANRSSAATPAPPSDAQPSRACVFIEENVKAKIENPQPPKPKNDHEGKIHIYTAEAVLPSPPKQAPRERAETKGPIPILEGRILAPHGRQSSAHVMTREAESSSDDESSLLSRTHRLKVQRSSSDEEQSDRNDHQEDIQLEKIIWLKPGGHSKDDGEEKIEEGDQKKYENAVTKIMDEGYDVLIIPISRKFSTAKDVATSLIEVMRGKRVRKDSNERRFKMTIRRL